MQQRAQTDATCNIQQCWELLVNNVASVCTQPYAQPAIGVIGIPWGPQGCAQRKALESQLFLVQFKDAFISTFQRPDLHQRKYQFLEEKHSLLGSLPQLSARRTLYDNSVYDNWLRPKGIAKVSGILEGSDFNIKSIYERLRKGLKRKY